MRLTLLLLLQSWALLEEKEGLYTRANELRSYSLQEQTSVVPPLNLGTQPDDPLITSVFKQVSLSWLLWCQAMPFPVALLTCVCCGRHLQATPSCLCCKAQVQTQQNAFMWL